MRDQSGTRAGLFAHSRTSGLDAKLMSIVNDQATATPPHIAPADIVEPLLCDRCQNPSIR